LALPHHLVCSNGGHCRPAPLGCFITSLRLCISPMPHDTLHALHSDQTPNRQSRYPVYKWNENTIFIKKKRHLEKEFSHLRRKLNLIYITKKNVWNYVLGLMNLVNMYNFLLNIVLNINLNLNKFKKVMYPMTKPY